MAIPGEQLEVARFLQDLAQAAPIETHISAVFVGPDAVWKLKKAVRLPYLDFTSLEARRHFLTRELELNRPAAPGLYRDVAAVVRDGKDALSLSANPGTGQALEWVLRMARIPKEGFLDTMAKRGGLDPALLDAIGDCVAHYHQATPRVDAWDSTRALLKIAAGNKISALAAGLPEASVQRWFDGITRALSGQASWLSRRGKEGFVRRAHGDLHLGNLCIWRGEPAPFDALEFDEELATIDVGYDLAFLLMDLDQQVARGAANRVMNRYIARTGDAELTRGLPAFLTMRAMIRSHVRAAAGEHVEGERYLSAALGYLDAKPAVLLAMGGLPGVGKSTIARILAPELGRAPGAVLLRSDEVRKRLLGAAPEQRLPEGAYDNATNARVARELVLLSQAVATGGQAVIADATFLDPALRTSIAASAAAIGVPFLGVWLHAPLAILESRVLSRKRDASDATLAVLRRAARRDAGPMGWLRVDALAGNRAVEEIRSRIARLVERERT